MPTGYTAAIAEGIDFKTYAMNCARAFGACITLRDEAGGGEMIPQEFKPSSYHKGAESNARAELERLGAMTPEACERAAAKDWDNAETLRTTSLQRARDLRAKYEQMLAKAQAWVAPTSDHVRFREFMIEQIEESIRFDCSEGHYANPTVRKTGAEWAAAERARLARDIAYHAKSYGEEVARAESRTAWVTALRDALEPRARDR
jgi:hypothetical protein